MPTKRMQMQAGMLHPASILSDGPDLKALKKEQKRLHKNQKWWEIIKHTAWILIVVASISALVVCLWTPVIRIYGKSMVPAMTDGDIVLTAKGNHFEPGDIIVFDYNHRNLVKRVIAGPGDWVDLDEDGNVYVNGSLLDEPYLEEKALGQTDIEYPFQVPEKHWFVMGDHRSVSVDSRTRSIGTVADDQIIGKIIWRLWPLNEAGPLH